MDDTSVIGFALPPFLPHTMVPEAVGLLATFDRRAPQSADARTQAQGLPDMLGADGARSYLLVYQDPADLRATGGYSGSASLLTLDHGRLAQTDSEASAWRSWSVPARRLLPLYWTDPLEVVAGDHLAGALFRCLPLPR